MLCHNTDLYRGPFIPTDGLRGHVSVDGLEVGDQVTIFGITKDKDAIELGYLSVECKLLIFDAKAYEYVRAVRNVTSNKPINVWVG